MVTAASHPGMGLVNLLDCVRSKPLGGLQNVNHKGNSSMLEHYLCFQDLNLITLLISDPNVVRAK